MKKILSLVLAGSLMLSMTACGGNSNEAPDENTGAVEQTTEEEPQEAVDIKNADVESLVVNTCGKDINELYISTGQGWSEELLEGTSIMNGGTMPVTIGYNVNLESYDFKAVCDGDEIEFKDMYFDPEGVKGITINLTETEGGYLATAE